MLRTRLLSNITNITQITGTAGGSGQEWYPIVDANNGIVGFQAFPTGSFLTISATDGVTGVQTTPGEAAQISANKGWTGHLDL